MILARSLTRPLLSWPWPQQYRRIVTLAIESSCDDSAVAIFKTHMDDTHNFKDQGCYGKIVFNQKVTANNNEFRGIHPIVSLASHQEKLSELVRRSLYSLPPATEEDIAGGRAISLPQIHSYYKKKRKYKRLRPQSVVWKRKPDFVSATRGPGMLSNLSVGLELSKGLAVAWGVPLVGVNHLHAHLLTPRLASSLRIPHQDHRFSCKAHTFLRPRFPFLSLLVSGGHTAVILSQSLYSHRRIAETCDIAVGDCLDKIARVVLPPGVLEQRDPAQAPAACLTKFALGGKGLENWKNSYQPQKTHSGLLQRRVHPQYGWSLVPPLSESKAGSRRNAFEFSFSGIVSSVERMIDFKWADGPSKEPRSNADLSNNERRAIALEAMRIVFEHIASRLLLSLEFVTDAHVLFDDICRMSSSDDRRHCVQALKRLIMKRTPGLKLDVDSNDDSLLDIDELDSKSLHTLEYRALVRLRERMENFVPTETSSISSNPRPCPYKGLVVSGGVAANQCLSHVLESNIRARGFDEIKLYTPPPQFCTDNAAMIAWSGYEMYRMGWSTSLTAKPLRKWWLDEPAGESRRMDDQTSQVDEVESSLDTTEVKGFLDAPGWIAGSVTQRKLRPDLDLEQSQLAIQEINEGE